MVQENNKAIDISIIIVNYNAFELLDDCISSLINKTKDVSYEIIVVDNNSDEGDIKEAIDKYKNIILIQNDTNRGFAYANNQAINIAKGKYLLFLNNDVLFIENSLKKIFEYAETLEGNVFIGCRLFNSDLSVQESISRFPSVWNIFTESVFIYRLFKRSTLLNKYYQNYIRVEKPFEVDVIKGAFIFCTKDSVLQLNGFDERFFFYSEEVDLCLRHRKIGGRNIFYPLTSVIHYEGKNDSKNRWFYFKNLMLSKIQFYQKHFSSLQFFFAQVFQYLGILLR